MTSLLETLVSPSSGGTESCQVVTTDDLQVGSPLDFLRQTLEEEKKFQCRKRRKHSYVLCYLKTNPRILVNRRMAF